MKDLKTLLESNSNWKIDRYDKQITDPDFIILNTDDKLIEFAKISDVQNDKTYFGSEEATKEVLNLKPMQSFEDSVNVYVRVK